MQENTRHSPFALLAVLIICFSFIFASDAGAQRYMEKLDRGLVAVRSGNGYFLSWRLFGTDPLGATFGFNVYKGSTKLNSAVITATTNYQDNSSGSGLYTVKSVTNGVEGEASEAALVLAQNYHSIPIQPPPAGTNPDGVRYTYSANDCSVGDLDGDGQYEIIVKWYPSTAQDNAFAGYTGSTILDAYKLNGTRLWRIDLGRNIRSGAHYTQFLVYDFDGNGRSEVVCKTADGTVDGKGVMIGSATADWRAKDGYVTTRDRTGSRTLADGTMVADLVGRILSGPEYLTVFDGLTGEALATVDYKPARGTGNIWGDTYGNRGERYLAAVAYLDGKRPSIVMCRGYYGKTVLWAVDWRDGRLTDRWLFDSGTSGNGAYGGQGCHSLAVGDVDGDGFDEIVYGSCTIDHNGKGLYSTRLGHGDALHLSDMNPDRPGLEVFQVHESPGSNGNIVASFRDARTGAIIWSNPGTSDNGRGVAAPLLAGVKGWQMWSSAAGGLLNLSGSNAGTKPSSNNFVIWWDGGLTRNLLDGTSITKYGGSTLLSASGCASNNGSKSNVGLSADILGDWREEVIWRTTNNTELRIYTTTTPTAVRLYTLMHDPVYRLSVAWQNVAYNQPPHPGIYIGVGMTLPPPKPDITYYSNTTSVIRKDPSSAQSKNTIYAAKRVMSLQDLTVPAGNNNQTMVSVFDLSGRLVGKAIVSKGTINVQSLFGLPRATYYVSMDRTGSFH